MADDLAMEEPTRGRRAGSGCVELALQCRQSWVSARRHGLVLSTLLLLPQVLMTTMPPPHHAYPAPPRKQCSEAAASIVWAGTGQCMRLRGGITAGRGRKLTIKSMPRAKSMKQVLACHPAQKP